MLFFMTFSKKDICPENNLTNRNSLKFSDKDMIRLALFLIIITLLLHYYSFSNIQRLSLAIYDNPCFKKTSIFVYFLIV